MSFVSTSIVTEKDRDPIIEGLLEELIEAVELGPEAVEQTLGEWCDRYPEREDAFRDQARAILLIWGLREPERLGPYQLLDVLTSGGMGKIYRAKEDVTGRIVVVKTVLAGHLSTPEQVKRFDTERRLLSRLHDTHIVPLLFTGREGYLLYLVMPFIPGVTLRSVIRSAFGRNPATEPFPTFETLFVAASKVESENRTHATGHPVDPGPLGSPAAEIARRSARGPDRLPAEYFHQVVTMMKQVSAAVEHIHRAKIIHRDLKPSNIMIESSGHSWVIDIGLGRVIDEAEDARLDTIGNPACTDEGMTQDIGTLAYMAPEQLGPQSGVADPTRLARHDARTDVWGLGATLYELLSLRLPFQGQTAAEIARKILSEPPARLNGSIPRELKAICLKALEKAPERRYASAGDLAADLRRWLDGLPTAAGKANILQQSGMWARRRPAAAFAAGMTAAFLLVASLGAVQVYQQVRAEAQAAQRTLDVLAVQRLRQPTRRMDWFASVWERLRALRGGVQSPDLLLQGQAAAAFEGIDAQIEKTMPGMAQVVEFDPQSKRLLMNRSGSDAQGATWSRTTLWDLTTDQPVVERDLGQGVLAFHPDGTPLQLSWVRGQPAESLPCRELVLAKVGVEIDSGKVCQRFRSPLEDLSDFRGIALSRQGSHLAAVAWPVRKASNKFIDEGDVSTIAIWNVDSQWNADFQEPIRILKHKATQDLILSPDGRLLAAWDESGEITVWTLPDGRELSRFRVGRAPVACLAFGRDPVWHEDNSVPPWLLAVGESSGLITVWDLHTHRQRSTCSGSEFDVRAMDFSTDGALLLSAGRHPAKLWDVARGICLLELSIGDHFQSAAFASDGQHCAISSGIAERLNRPVVSILKFELGHGIQTLYGLQGVVDKAIFSADGRLIAAASHEWHVGVWERQSGRLLGVLPAPAGRFADSIGMAFDPSGRRFACSVGHEARLWDIQERRMIARWGLPEGLCDSVAFSDDDHLILVRQETKSREGGRFNAFPPEKFPRVVRLYDLLSAKPTHPLTEIDAFDRDVRSIQMAPNGSLFAVDGVGTDQGRGRRRFHVYEGPTGRILRGLPTSPGRNDSFWFFFDADAKILAVPLGEAAEAITLFGLPNLDYRGVTRAPMACLSPGARWSMNTTLDQPPTLALYDLATGQPLMQLAQDIVARQLSLNFSPDGRHAIFGRKDGTVSVLDLVEVNQRLTGLHLGWRVAPQVTP